MNLKSQSVLIDKDNPWIDDRLEREKFAKTVNSILTQTKRSLVLNIDGPYGSGKSFILQRLHQSLLNQKRISVYFDAWKTDFAEEPFVVFVAELSRQFEEQKLLTKQKKKEFIKKASSYLAKRLLPAAIKLSTAGILRSDDFGLDSSTASEIGNIADRIASEQMERFAATENALSEFQNYLSTIVLSLRQSDEFDGDSIIVFIDELDRCRPSYAIKLLETIKHLLSLDGVIFCLASDMRQFEEAVRSTYGISADAAGYWNRLIDLNISLPVNSALGFIESRTKDLGILSNEEVNRNHFVRYVSFLCHLFSLSLRLCDKYLVRIYLIQVLYQDPRAIYEEEDVITLNIIRENKKEVFNLLVNLRSSPLEIANTLAQKLNFIRYEPDSNKEYFVNFWRIVFLTQIERNKRCPAIDYLAKDRHQAVESLFMSPMITVQGSGSDDHIPLAQEGYVAAQAAYEEIRVRQIQGRGGPYMEYLLDKVSFAARLVR